MGKHVLCPYCGTSHWASQSRLKRNRFNRFYCTRECYRIYMRKNPDEFTRTYSGMFPARISLSCERCGKIFERKRREYLKTFRAFCSSRCSLQTIANNNRKYFDQESYNIVQRRRARERYKRDRISCIISSAISQFGKSAGLNRDSMPEEIKKLLFAYQVGVRISSPKNWKKPGRTRIAEQEAIKFGRGWLEREDAYERKHGETSIGHC